MASQAKILFYLLLFMELSIVANGKRGALTHLENGVRLETEAYESWEFRNSTSWLEQIGSFHADHPTAVHIHLSGFVGRETDCLMALGNALLAHSMEKVLVTLDAGPLSYPNLQATLPQGMLLIPGGNDRHLDAVMAALDNVDMSEQDMRAARMDVERFLRTFSEIETNLLALDMMKQFQELGTTLAVLSERNWLPDLMVIDCFSWNAIHLAEHFEIPYLLLHTSSPVSALSSPLATTFTPWSVPIRDSASPYLQHLYRFINWHGFQKLVTDLSLPKDKSSKKVIRRISKASQRELVHRTKPISLLYSSVPIISESFFGLDYYRTLPPNLHLVGPLLRPVSDDEAPIMTDHGAKDGAKKCVVVDFYPENTKLSTAAFKMALHEIMDEFMASGIEVIWAGSNQVIDVPSTLTTKTSTAAAREKCSVAILSSCHFNSFILAIDHQLPILCLPSTAQEAEIAEKVEAMGYGRRMLVRGSRNITSNFVKKVKAGDYLHELQRANANLKKHDGTTSAAAIILSLVSKQPIEEYQEPLEWPLPPEYTFLKGVMSAFCFVFVAVMLFVYIVQALVAWLFSARVVKRSSMQRRK